MGRKKKVCQNLPPEEKKKSVVRIGRKETPDLRGSHSQRMGSKRPTLVKKGGFRALAEHGRERERNTSDFLRSAIYLSKGKRTAKGPSQEEKRRLG